MRVGTAAATYLATTARANAAVEPSSRDGAAAKVELSDRARALARQAAHSAVGLEARASAVSQTRGVARMYAQQSASARSGVVPAAGRISPRGNEARLGDDAAAVVSSSGVRPRTTTPAQRAHDGARSALGRPEADEAGVGAGASEPDDELSGAAGATQDEAATSEELRELQSRDREVRVHEQTHKAAGGRHAGAIHYDTQTGPDGKRYAVGGHVNIDVAPVEGDPEATLRKMEVVRKAALAPADPSAADRQVAASAAATAASARAELAKERIDGVSSPAPGE